MSGRALLSSSGGVLRSRGAFPKGSLTQNRGPWEGDIGDDKERTGGKPNTGPMRPSDEGKRIPSVGT